MRRWPLLYQILTVNSLVVLLGAIAGTALTRRLASQSSIDLTVFFAALGLLLSLLANYALLRVALRPLLVLQAVAERVAGGDMDVRTEQLEHGEPTLAHLAHTFNSMLDRLEEDNRAIERSRVVSVQLAQQALSAQEEERLRIARELHDETLQSLATLVIYADAAYTASHGHDESALRDALDRLRQVADYTIVGIRTVIADLRPSLLDDVGLAAAIRWQAQNRVETAGIHADVQIRGEERRLSRTVEVALYRVVQEAISNILKHSAAKYVEIDLDLRSQDVIALRVEDDGIGFVPSPTIAVTGAGVGLFGMRERINLLGGRLVVDSSPGEGTEIRAVVPGEGRSLQHDILDASEDLVELGRQPS